MHISQAGLSLIESFEGYSFHAYWDPFGSVWTVGYGETENVGPGTTMTREQAQQDLMRRLAREYEPAINALGVPLNQHQFDALCSFVWNLGPGSMQWDVGRFLRARNYRAAADAMLAYDHAGGVVLAGLVRRRQAERALFLTRWVDPDPHHYNRFEAIPRRVGLHRRASERQTVEEYDRKRAHWLRFPGRLRRLKGNCAVLADRIETVMEHGDPTGKLHHRKWRRDQLNGRADGRRYV